MEQNRRNRTGSSVWQLVSFSTGVETPSLGVIFAGAYPTVVLVAAGMTRDGAQQCKGAPESSSEGTLVVHENDDCGCWLTVPIFSRG